LEDADRADGVTPAGRAAIESELTGQPMTAWAIRALLILPLLLLASPLRAQESDASLTAYDFALERRLPLRLSVNGGPAIFGADYGGDYSLLSFGGWAGVEVSKHLSWTFAFVGGLKGGLARACFERTGATQDEETSAKSYCGGRLSLVMMEAGTAFGPWGPFGFSSRLLFGHLWFSEELIEAETRIQGSTTITDEILPSDDPMVGLSVDSYFYLTRAEDFLLGFGGTIAEADGMMLIGALRVGYVFGL
jgi:hypothetical protein